MRTKGTRTRAWALACSMAATLALPAALPAATTTTKPSQFVLIQVGIHDTGVHMGVQMQVEPGQYSYTSPNAVLRGQIGDFQVHNMGKKAHNFSVLGKTTKAIPPNGTAIIHLQFLKRGTFPWRSTLDKNKKGFRGVIIVT